MCIYEKEFRGQQFIGYKAVLIGDGKFYSPCTLIEYKPGPVANDKVQTETTFYKDVLNPESLFHNPNHIGRTAVFATLAEAEGELYYLRSILLSSFGVEMIERKLGVQSIDAGIVEMTIGSTPRLPEMYRGISSHKETVSGSNIIAVKLLSTTSDDEK